MHDLRNLLAGLEEKINKLIVHNQELRAINEHLAQENNQLLTILEQQKQSIQQLEENPNGERIKTTVLDDDQKNKMQLTIDQLLVDIEKSIASLQA